MPDQTTISMRDARDALDRELLARDEIDELLAGYVDIVRARCRVRLGSHGDDAAQAVCERSGNGWNSRLLANPQVALGSGKPAGRT